MRVYIIGVGGTVGRLLAADLRDRGDDVAGLVRQEEQRAALRARGVAVHVGELAGLTAGSLAPLLTRADVVVYAAGTDGSVRRTTAAVDGDGAVTALEATGLAGVGRFVLLSVLPESGRRRHLGEDAEFFFAVKKLVEVTVSASDLDWLVLRPSLVVDRAGTGTVALGPAQPDDEIPREDVAATLAELAHQPGVSRRILEVTQGLTPIPRAVSDLL